MFLSLPFIVRIIIATFVAFAIIVALQNPQVFPGAVMALFNSKVRDQKTLPVGVESKFIKTIDLKLLETWHFPAQDSKQVAIIFHGNAGDVANFFPYQEYFQELSITSYGFDYRGYGKSSGWPTVKGLYLDGEAIIQYVLEKEQITPKELIIVGISVGSGPATYIAQKYNVGTLLLYSPFESLKAAVKSQPVLGFLHPFLISDFPVKALVQKLNNTCLIVAHGVRDSVIPQVQGKMVAIAHPNRNRSFFIASNKSGHNDIYFWTKAEVQKNLTECQLLTTETLETPES